MFDAGMRACSQPCGGGEERKKSAQTDGRDPGERHRHAAEGVQADVDPRNAGEIQAEAEPEAAPEAQARRRVHPQMDQVGEGRRGEREYAGRRECQHSRRAGEKRTQVLGLSTSSV
jgi:hypothetical protein